ncbi:MAG: AMP-binding enzyme, partial [Actinomycetes bacterium]
IGVPDRVLGEKSCAVVVPAGDPPTLPVLREFLVCRGMAEYKVPDQLRVVTSLPRTNPGKVDKKALRKLVGSRSQQAQKSRPAETR